MSNPVFNLVERQQEREYIIDESKIMTVDGTIQSTVFMGLILLVAAGFTWSRYSLGYTDLVSMLTFGGVIIGFILALIISFARKTFLVPAYAVCEGCALGGISAVMEAGYPGIVSQAVAGTFAALFSMLLLYKMNVIRCTEKFRSVIYISTLSIAGIYLIDLIGRFFGHSIPMINTSSSFGILFSVIVIAIAALNLIIDFNFIERAAAERMLPKDFEWYGAFGLMVTIVWLYLEILNLLLKLRGRD